MLSQAHICQQIFSRLGAAVARQFFPLRLADRLRIDLERRSKPDSAGAPPVGGLLILHGLEKMADMRARFGGNHVIQPGGLGLACDAVMISTRSPLLSRSAAARSRRLSWRRRSGCRYPYGPRTRNRRRSSLGQRQYLALWREHVDFAGKQIDFEMFQKFQRIGGIAQGLEQALQPLMRFLCRSLRSASVLL